ncbi:MAG: hypothetical protein U1E78_08890 [Gammaproteobacteria bacterium]
MKFRGRFILISFLSYMPHATASDMGEIQNLVNLGDYQAAYREAESALIENEGDPKFDYLYGMTAVKSNHNGPGLFALERVLAVEPDNHQAHYYYALAYYQSNMYAKAYLEARRLQKKVIDKSLAEEVEKLIVKIQREHKDAKQKWVFVSLTGGYDSNVNGGVNQSGVQLVNVGFVPLDPDAKRFTSDFLEAKVGAGLVWPLHGKITAQAMGSWRRNERAHIFDTDDYVFYLKYQFPFLDYHLSFPFILERENLDGHEFRNTKSAAIELAYPATQNFTLRPYLSLIELDYPKDASQTSNVYWAGLGFETRHDWKGFTNIKPFYGVQQVNDHQYRYNNRSFGGLELNLRYLKWNQTIPFLYLSYQRSDYQHPHALLGTGQVKRGDDYYRGEAGLDWRFAKHFFMTAAAIREVNESNLDVFEYHRTLYKLSLTYSSL